MPVVLCSNTIKFLLVYILRPEEIMFLSHLLNFINLVKYPLLINLIKCRRLSHDYCVLFQQFYNFELCWAW